MCRGGWGAPGLHCRRVQCCRRRRRCRRPRCRWRLFSSLPTCRPATPAGARKSSPAAVSTRCTPTASRLRSACRRRPASRGESWSTAAAREVRCVASGRTRPVHLSCQLLHLATGCKKPRPMLDHQRQLGCIAPLWLPPCRLARCGAAAAAGCWAAGQAAAVGPAGLQVRPTLGAMFSKMSQHAACAWSVQC